MIYGLAYVVGASLLFGVVPSANKYVMLSGLTAECSTFWREVTICTLALALAKWSGHSLRIDRMDALHLSFIGATGMGITNYLVSSACLYIPVGLATVLHFLYPTIVCVVMVARFGQRMTKLKVGAILCSISGMVLIANLKADGGLNLIGLLFALVSSLTYSFYIISNEQGRINQIPLIVKLFYSALGSTIFFGVLCLTQGILAVPLSLDVAVIQFGVSGVGSLGAFYLLTAGIRCLGASAASFVNMLEPVTSLIVGALVYQEYPTPAIACGVVLVLCSVLFVAIDSMNA